MQNCAKERSPKFLAENKDFLIVDLNLPYLAIFVEVFLRQIP